MIENKSKHLMCTCLTLSIRERIFGFFVVIVFCVFFFSYNEQFSISDSFIDRFVTHSNRRSLNNINAQKNSFTLAMVNHRVNSFGIFFL